jgi:hypothetical protein
MLWDLFFVSSINKIKEAFTVIVSKEETYREMLLHRFKIYTSKIESKSFKCFNLSLNISYRINKTRKTTYSQTISIYL